MDTAKTDTLPRTSEAPPADVVELARALVSIPSINPSLDPAGTGEAAIARLTAGWLEAWGFDVRLVDAGPGRTSVVARLRGGPGPTLILNGHLDTVGIDGMTVEPFAAEVRDGRLWGRGACDMKAGVAAILAAGRDVAATGTLAGELVIALTADEEHAGIGCRALVDAGLTGDGAIVCEPTGLALMPAHKGFTWAELTFRGRAAHGSRPDRGIDAIRHAGLFLARLEALERRLETTAPHPLLGHASVHAGTIRGGSAPSVYPDRCRLVLERRTLPGEPETAFAWEIDALLAELRQSVADVDVVSEITMHRGGSEIAADHPLARTLAAAVEEAGGAPAIEGMSAWVEAVVFNEAGIPALCFGPGRIEDAHSADESVDLEELRVAHRALVALVRRLPW